MDCGHVRDFENYSIPKEKFIRQRYEIKKFMEYAKSDIDDRQDKELQNRFLECRLKIIEALIEF